MAQLVNTLAIKPDGLSLISRINIVEGPPNKHRGTHTINKCSKYLLKYF